MHRILLHLLCCCFLLTACADDGSDAVTPVSKKDPEATYIATYHYSYNTAIIPESLSLYSDVSLAYVNELPTTYAINDAEDQDALNALLAPGHGYRFGDLDLFSYFLIERPANCPDYYELGNASYLDDLLMVFFHHFEPDGWLCASLPAADDYERKGYDVYRAVKQGAVLPISTLDPNDEFTGTIGRFFHVDVDPEMLEEVGTYPSSADGLPSYRIRTQEEFELFNQGRPWDEQLTVDELDKYTYLLARDWNYCGEYTLHQSYTYNTVTHELNITWNRFTDDAAGTYACPEVVTYEYKIYRAAKSEGALPADSSGYSMESRINGYLRLQPFDR